MNEFGAVFETREEDSLVDRVAALMEEGKVVVPMLPVCSSSACCAAICSSTRFMAMVT